MPTWWLQGQDHFCRMSCGSQWGPAGETLLSRCIESVTATRALKTRMSTSWQGRSSPCFESTSCQRSARSGMHSLVGMARQPAEVMESSDQTRMSVCACCAVLGVVVFMPPKKLQRLHRRPRDWNVLAEPAHWQVACRCASYPSVPAGLGFTWVDIWDASLGGSFKSQPLWTC